MKKIFVGCFFLLFSCMSVATGTIKTIIADEGDVFVLHFKTGDLQWCQYRVSPPSFWKSLSISLIATSEKDRSKSRYALLENPTEGDFAFDTNQPLTLTYGDLNKKEFVFDPVTVDGQKQWKSFNNLYSILEYNQGQYITFIAKQGIKYKELTFIVEELPLDAYVECVKAIK